MFDFVTIPSDWTRKISVTGTFIPFLLTVDRALLMAIETEQVQSFQYKDVWYNTVESPRCNLMPASVRPLQPRGERSPLR